MEGVVLDDIAVRIEERAAAAGVEVFDADKAMRSEFHHSPEHDEAGDSLHKRGVEESYTFPAALYDSTFDYAFRHDEDRRDDCLY